MYFLYSILLSVAALLTSPYWLFRALSTQKYFRSLPQRFGLQVPSLRLSQRPLWIHAVSVGEVLAAKVLLTALRSGRHDLPVVISTVTTTGQALAKKELAAAAIFYFPFDWAFCVRRFLSAVNPRAVVLIETELWPRFLKECRTLRVPVYLANGRISDSSFERYRRIRRMTRAMLANVKLIGVQTQEYKHRLLELGAREEQVEITGNLKFDFPAPVIEKSGKLLLLIRTSLRLTDPSPVIVIGSSMRGEEPVFVEAFKKVRQAVPQVRLILAPRHPERFDEVAALLQDSGISFTRRTEIESSAGPDAEILLLDSVGELRAVYSLATLAVIGGSFQPPFGGHNPLEPAVFGKAIVFGPEMSNFKEMASLFLSEQAARQCSKEDLPAVLIQLLRDTEARTRLGQRAQAALRQNQGAADCTLSFLLPDLN